MRTGLSLGVLLHYVQPDRTTRPTCGLWAGHVAAWPALLFITVTVRK